jgi:uncharacterized membrane protein YfcA
LIIYTYNEAFERKIIWPSLIMMTYFEMIRNVLPLVALPAAAMGIFGAIIGNRITLNKKIDYG